MRTQIDKKLSGQACFIDLKKSFNSFDHNVLLRKLHAYGLRRPLYDFFENYLKHRMQYVFWDKKNLNTLDNYHKGTPRVSFRTFLVSILYQRFT